MVDIKKIGIITSGGDCGGLNAVVKGTALAANNSGIKCYVIPNGYAGLYNLVDFDELVELTPDRTDLISPDLAGSEAGHSRVKIKKITDENKYERIKEGLKNLGTSLKVDPKKMTRAALSWTFLNKAYRASTCRKPWTLTCRLIPLEALPRSTGSPNSRKTLKRREGRIIGS